MDCLPAPLSPGKILYIVFSASVLETIYALSVSCVSVFPRLQSLLCVPDQSVLLWSSSVLHWWAPGLSALLWRSSALSAPHWWAPSAPPWRSSALFVPPWWSAVWFWWSSALPW